MSFFNKLVIKVFYTKIGADEFGNVYYESNNADNYGKKKRYVIYNGMEEPSKVPPLWHAWLHYMSNEIPLIQDKDLFWYKKYLPNLTGTKWSYSPLRSKELNETGVRPQVSADYVRWQPK